METPTGVMWFHTEHGNKKYYLLKHTGDPFAEEVLLHMTETSAHE